jgi:hypothetical protein
MTSSTGRFTTELRRLVHDHHNLCSLCARPLPRHQPAYAGFNAADRPIYVGVCCRDNVVELASHIYWWWTDYPRPSSEQALWRYMDLAKLISLLDSRSLFCARADTLGDRYEGARGVSAREREWRRHCMEYFIDAVQTVPGRGRVPDDFAVKEAERLYADMQKIGDEEVRRSYVSCWHASTTDSEALWRLYCPPGTTGVAVKTTFRSLYEALDNSHDIRFGHVQYIDFSKRFAGTHDRLFWKRSSLAHEAEVRGVVRSHGDHENLGISIALDLSRAIEAVVVSPFAPAWATPLVGDLIQKYGAQVRVTDSAIRLDPFF